MKNILDSVSIIFYTTSDIYDIPPSEPVMPFREKSAWISLLATTGVWGTYFWILWPDLQDRSLSPSAVGLFIGGVVVLTIVQIILAIALAVTSGKAANAPMDEREQLIDLKGARAGFYALNGAVFCVSALWMLKVSPLFMANGILAAMVVGEMVRSGWIIIAYRRGV